MNFTVMTQTTDLLDLDDPVIISPEPGHKLRIEKRSGKCIIDHEIDGVTVAIMQIPLDPYEEKPGPTN